MPRKKPKVGKEPEPRRRVYCPAKNPDASRQRSAAQEANAAPETKASPEAPGEVVFPVNEPPASTPMPVDMGPPALVAGEAKSASSAVGAEVESSFLATARRAGCLIFQGQSATPPAQVAGKRNATSDSDSDSDSDSLSSAKSTKSSDSGGDRR